MECLSIIIIFFSKAILHFVYEYCMVGKNEKSIDFWMIHPFFSPLILTLSMILGVIIKVDLTGYGALIVLVQEFVFWCIKKKSLKTI